MTDERYANNNSDESEEWPHNRRAGEACDSEERAYPAEEIAPAEEGEEEGEEPSEVEVLQREVTLLGQQLQQMRDRYIRSVADLDNARKRARQAIADARHQAVGGVLLDVLTLVDNFERALETSRPGPETPPDTRAVYDGVEMIYRQVLSLLEKRGVTPIEAIGESFDPTKHEAVVQVPADRNHPEGTVALEMQKGYMHGDRVLRPSRVGVAVRE